jgi:hypothetical protein
MDILLRILFSMDKYLPLSRFLEIYGTHSYKFSQFLEAVDIEALCTDPGRFLGQKYAS